MSLKVIASGFGRTGTDSIGEALEILGFGLYHHMREPRKNPGKWTPLACSRGGKGTGLGSFTGLPCRLR